MKDKRRRMLRRFDGKKLGWFHDIRRLLIIFLALFLAFRFVLGVSAVDGVSMRETLQSGDIVLYTRINNDVKRGDIIAIALPGGEFYVKRVVAMAGDTVDIKDGTFYINGEPEEGSYYMGLTYEEDGSFSYPYTVGEGCVFTLGDNREGSVDSRYYGTFALSQVTGIIRMRLGLLYFEFF